MDSVTKFKYSYFDTTQTSESCKHEKMMNRQKLWNACCYHSVQHTLNEKLLFLWAQDLVCHINEERRVRVFENRALRKMFRYTREEVRKVWRKMK